MSRRTWVFSPNVGGKKIPPAVQTRTEKRICEYAEKHYAGIYARLDIRFRGQFCYIDAYTEPNLPEGWPPADYGETRAEMLERLRNTTTHLCRLRFFGDQDRWGFAFYTYSQEKYELSVFDNGDFFGNPEDAFAASAVYLEG